MSKTKITLEVESFADLLAQVQNLVGTTVPSTSASAEAGTEKRTRKKTTAEVAATPDAPTPAPAHVVVTPDQQCVATPLTTTNPVEVVATFAEVADVIPKVVLKLGKPVAIALLAEFKVKKGGELTSAQYGPFVARANGLLDGSGPAPTLAV